MVVQGVNISAGVEQGSDRLGRGALLDCAVKRCPAPIVRFADRCGRAGDDETDGDEFQGAYRHGGTSSLA